MKIDINEQYLVVLSGVYNPVIIRDESGGGIVACERDGQIEVVPLSPKQPSHSAEPAEICSDDICDYCVGCGEMSNCNEYSGFNGLKLHQWKKV